MDGNNHSKHNNHNHHHQQQHALVDLDYEYLQDMHLKGFDNYKYSSKDTSPISVYVMHPFWNWLVQFFPRWVAPNVMTFLGFMMTAANLVILALFDYQFYASTSGPLSAPIAQWWWIVIGLSLFIAYTLDGIDGKQARRTGSSGPLGEMFDHGLDSYACSIVPICLYSCFGRLDNSLSTLRFYFVLWNILISFYMTHWEKYNTGVLFLPWGYDFGMLSSAFVFIVTGIFGHSMWKNEMPFGLTSGTMFEILIYLTSFACNLPVTLYNIRKSYDLKTGKCYGVGEALRPLVGLGAMFVLMSLWVVISPNDILNYDPRAVYVLVGTLFSNVTCRLIVAQMSNTRCDMFNALMLPLGGTLFMVLWAPKSEFILLYINLVVSMGAHLHYGTCVVRQMCRHFKIDCFKIKAS